MSDVIKLSKEELAKLKDFKVKNVIDDRGRLSELLKSENKGNPIESAVKNMASKDLGKESDKKLTNKIYTSKSTAKDKL